MITKSKPSGIRFDIEKSDYIKGKEKLTSFQQVVDFLMNKYWWEHKVATPTHKEAPPLHLKEGNGQTAAEAPMNQNNHKLFQPNPTPKTVIRYITERLECDTSESYEKWLDELEKDPYLSKKDKQLAKTGRLD